MKKIILISLLLVLLVGCINVYTQPTTKPTTQQKQEGLTEEKAKQLALEKAKSECWRIHEQNIIDGCNQNPQYAWCIGKNKDELIQLTHNSPDMQNVIGSLYVGQSKVTDDGTYIIDIRSYEANDITYKATVNSNKEVYVDVGRCS